MRKLSSLAIVVIFFWPYASVQAAPPDALELGPVGVVTTVVDGDTVRIKGTDADIRLVGIQAPKLPLGRKNFKTWPLAEESQQALEDLVKNRSVTLRLAPVARDRNGRILAHLVRDDGLWVQGEMLRAGFARVYTFPDNRKLAVEMLALETQARNANRGIWANDFYKVRDALSPTLKNEAGTFQVVAGIVKETAKTKDRMYVNFGDDYRTDFTVSVEKADWPQFKAAKLDVLALKGAHIEVRGWIVSRNGPTIEATHPEQIILLGK